MKIKLVLFLFTLFLLCSCEQVIDIKLPPHEPRLSVHAVIEKGDSVLLAWVGYTVGILDTTELSNWFWDEDSLRFSSSPWVNNAIVRIYENDQLIGTLQAEAHLHLYRLWLNSPLQAIGKNYELEVSAPDYPTARATLSFPRQGQIADLRYEPLAGKDNAGNDMDRISFNLIDPPGKGEVYNFSVIVGHFNSFDNQIYEYSAYISSADPLLEQGNSNLLFTDANHDGQTYPVQFLCYPIDTFGNGYGRLVVSNNTRAEYFFNKSYRDYVSAQGNPFAEPVVLYSNIENGRGLFLGRISQRFVLIN